MVTLVNRAKMTTSTTGTGTITLSSADLGYQTFADAGVTDGNTVRYVIEDGNNWEIGSGTYTASGTTLSRTVSESSNAGSAISLSGSAKVFISATSTDLDAKAETLADLGVTASSAELNLLDGVTATTAELNYVDGVTSNIQTQLDAKGTVSSLSDLSVTATAAELNLLDGVTATTSELNYVDIATLGTSQASKAVTADASGNIKLSEEVQATCYLETVIALSGTTPTVDCDEANSFTLTTSGNTTFTFSYAGVNLTTNDAYGFTLKVTAGGTHTLTWPASVDWAGGSAPDAPASGETDVFVFYTVDGGTNWYGALAIDAAA